MLNSVILIGRLARKPEIRQASSGNSFCPFTLVVSNYENGNEKANYITCFAWEKTAENMEKFLDKGSLIAVNGNLRSRKNQTSGYSEMFVNAYQVKFLEPKKTTRYVDDIDFDVANKKLTKEEKKDLDATFNKDVSIDENKKENIENKKDNQENNTSKKDDLSFDVSEIDW